MISNKKGRRKLSIPSLEIGHLGHLFVCLCFQMSVCMVVRMSAFWELLKKNRLKSSESFESFQINKVHLGFPFFSMVWGSTTFWWTKKLFLGKFSKNAPPKSLRFSAPLHFLCIFFYSFNRAQLHKPCLSNRSVVAPKQFVTYPDLLFSTSHPYFPHFLPKFRLTSQLILKLPKS